MSRFTSGVLRLLDLVLAGIGLVVSAPVLGVIAVLGFFDTGSPFFRQERLGRHQEPFTLIKFRTMKVDTASVASHMADRTAITPLGRFLRRTKVDELPQLINVIRGEMSMVGPRPGLPNQLELLDARDRHGVFAARPGITGLAQVNGVDMSTPELLAQTDAEMIKTMSIRVYLRLIALTLRGAGQGDALVRRMSDCDTIQTFATADGSMSSRKQMPVWARSLKARRLASESTAINRPRRRIVFAVTDGIQLPYLGDTPYEFARAGYHVTVVSSTGGGEIFHDLDRRVIPMVREPKPAIDLLGLGYWVRLLKQIRPQAVFLGTPKAALLGMVAAFLVRTPVRLYLLRGLRLESATGIRRCVYWLVERLTFATATEVVAISPSLAARAHEIGLVGRRGVAVLGRGSSHGVDLGRFGIDPERRAHLRRQVRNDLAIPEDAFVVGYVGRVRTDKGVKELLEACSGFVSGCEYLVMVGRIEEDHLRHALYRSGTEHLRIVPHSERVQDYFAALDVLALPSHREGFGNVVIESGAMGVPSVVSNATGVRDAVVHGETGLIVPVRDVHALRAAIYDLKDPRSRKRLGEQARMRVIRHYDQQLVNRRFVEHVDSRWPR